MAGKNYLCLFSLVLVLNSINKIIAYKQINIVQDWIVINNSSETELNKLIRGA